MATTALTDTAHWTAPLPPDPVARARFLAYLDAAGGSLGLLALAVQPDLSEPGAMLALIATAYLLAAVAWLRRRTISLGALQVFVALGSVLISLAIELTAPTGTSPFVFMYIWVTLYAFYYFTVAQGLSQLAVLGIAYALLADPEMVWWLVAMGTMGAAGALTVLVRGRIAELVSRLEELAVSDPLTGLLNRRGFDEALDLALERSRRNGLPVCLLLGDLDHFKRLNDRAGHDAGDIALRRVARVLEAGKRRPDTVGRFGGEEFALVLPDTGETGGLAIAERLRLTVRETFSTYEVSLRISFGIAVFPSHAQTPDDLVRAADAALYEAKRRGRDRSVPYGADVSDPIGAESAGPWPQTAVASRAASPPV